MTTVNISSDDWRDLKNEIAELTKDNTATKLEVSRLKTDLQDMSLILVGDEKTPGLKTVMYSINSNLRLIKWLIITLLAGLTVYYGAREVRGKDIAEEKQVSHIVDKATTPRLDSNVPAITRH